MEPEENSGAGASLVLLIEHHRLQPFFTKTIILTTGQIAKVDDEDFERLNQFSWRTNKDGHAKNTFRGIDILMHRAVLGKSSLVCHHKDGNKLNNQKYNLELMPHNAHSSLHYRLKKYDTK